MDAPPPAEIVIVAPRLPEPARDEAFSVSRIDLALIANAPRLDEALAASPSASLFRRSSSLSANATIQGASLRAIAPSGAGRALVTLEGAPLNDPFGGWVIWSGVPAESIGAIRIIRGAGAGPYGAGALTGVIALEDAPPQTFASLTLGERGYMRAVAIGEAGDITFAIAGERTDGDRPVRIGAGAADVRAEFESLGASARWLAPNGAMSVRLGLYDESRGAGQIGVESRARGAHTSITYAQTRAGGGWRLQGWAALSDFSNTSASLSADRNTATPANDQYRTPALGLGANIAYRVQSGSLEWEVGGDVRYAQGESRERFRNLGAGFTRGRVAGGANLIGGVYIEGTQQTGMWLITGGARLDHYSAFDARRDEFDLTTGVSTLSERPSDAEDVVPSLRLGLRRDMGAIDLRAAAYSGFRPPTLNELHRPFRVGGDVTEANSALDPERLVGAEIGLDGPNWRATLFYNRLDDAIGNLTIGQGPGTFPRVGFLPAGSVYRQRANLGRIDAFGFEAEANWSFGPSVDVRIAVAATDAEVVEAPGAPQLIGLAPAQAPELTATFGAIWRIDPRWTFAADARWESARWEDDLNTRRLDPALNVDARLRLQLTNHATLTLSAENLLDAEIETAETATGVESFAPARLLSIGLTFR